MLYNRARNTMGSRLKLIDPALLSLDFVTSPSTFNIIQKIILEGEITE